MAIRAVPDDLLPNARVTSGPLSDCCGDPEHRLGRGAQGRASDPACGSSCRPVPDPARHGSGLCDVRRRRAEPGAPPERDRDRVLRPRPARGRVRPRRPPGQEPGRPRAGPALVRVRVARRRHRDAAPGGVVPDRLRDRRPAGHQQPVERRVVPALPPRARAGGRRRRTRLVAARATPAHRRGPAAGRRPGSGPGAAPLAAHRGRPVHRAAGGHGVRRGDGRARRRDPVGAPQRTVRQPAARLGRGRVVPVLLRRAVQRDRRRALHPGVVGQPVDAGRDVRRAGGRLHRGRADRAAAVGGLRGVRAGTARAAARRLVDRHPPAAHRDCRPVPRHHARGRPRGRPGERPRGDRRS